MAEIYLVDGKQVRIVSKFSDLWLGTEELNEGAANPKIVQLVPTKCIPVENPSIPPMTAQKPVPQMVPTPVADSQGTVTIFSMNTAMTSKEIADALVGIGKVYARKILDRKPDAGYRDWQEVKDLNPDINLNWDEIIRDNANVVFKLGV